MKVLRTESLGSDFTGSYKKECNSHAVAHKRCSPRCSRILAKAICATIQPEFRVPTDLFLLFAHDHSTKIYGPLSFNLSFVDGHSTKN